MSAQPRWDHTEPAPRPVEVRASGARAEPDRNAARIVSVIALASIAAGAINVAAAATVGRGSAQNLAFFGVVGAAQLVWGAVTLAWAPRWWLALGALGNAVVVATWVLSRTVGLPVRRVRRRRAAGRVLRQRGHDLRGRDRCRRGGAGGSRIGPG